MSETLAKYEAKQLDNYTIATNVAHLCKAIVTATAQNIQGRKYVKCEGWQAIATAHGCCASARDVEAIEGGIRCIGEVRRMDTGATIATAEGFVGDDEKTWASRPLYARRAMCQTRAISRACRSAFAHVVVMMNAGLETCPAEEVPAEGFEHAKPVRENTTPPAQQKHAPTSTPATDLPAALAALTDGQTVKLEVAFDKILPPPEGKKAHRVYLSGREYPTLHTFDGCVAGDKLMVEFKASAFNGKMYVWADSHQNLQAEELPMGAAPEQAEPSAPLTPPKGVREIWPEQEFDASTEVIRETIVNVLEPKTGKSGKPGPYKVEIQHGGQVCTLDTFEKPLAALAHAMGAGGEPVDIAFRTVQNGKWTNRTLIGLR